MNKIHPEYKYIANVTRLLQTEHLNRVQHDYEMFIISIPSVFTVIFSVFLQLKIAKTAKDIF